MPRPIVKKKKKGFGDFHLSRIDSMPLFRAANHPNPKISEHPKVLEAIEAANHFTAAHEDTVKAAINKARAKTSRKPSEYTPPRTEKQPPQPHLDFFKAISTGRARHIPDEIVFAHIKNRLNGSKTIVAGEALSAILTAYKRFGFSDELDALRHLYQFIHSHKIVSAEITAEELAEIKREKERVSVLKKQHQKLNLSPRARLALNIQNYAEHFQRTTGQKPDNYSGLVHGIIGAIRELEEEEKTKRKF